MLKNGFLLLILICQFGFSQLQQLPIIPKPKIFKVEEGVFVLSNQTVIQAPKESFEADFLQKAILQRTGIELKIEANPKTASIINLSLIVPSNSDFNKELHTVSINENYIQIQAASNQGLFYGIQSLIQLLPFETKSEIKLTTTEIVDQPKFKWRGLHLDVCRHFFSKEFVKKYIDYLAMYKMNTFHWHLTDDQGWRIEIKKYPKLTEVGAWRNGSMVGHYNENTYDDERHGGFYTQEDIKEIIAYAQQRHITIVPEIEMPGHALAALASYPEYSCTGGPFEVSKQWGVLDDVFCPKEETVTFLENILSEVIPLFPSEYIHIGGDECPKTRWKNCSNCQNLIKSKGLKDEHELQSYFIQRIERFVNSKGKKIIGWDEILEGGLAPNAAVMSWRGTEGGIEAAKQKHYVVMTPGSHCYFDHYQGDPKNEPLAIGGYTNLEKVYSFNPIPEVLTNEESQYILGAQGNLWTEYIADEKKVEYMIFPRMMALAEVLWGTSNATDFTGFQQRVIGQFQTLDKLGINYSKAIFEVTSTVNPSKSGNGIEFQLKSANNNNGIRYTIDGTDPKATSLSYTNPISITQNTTVKAAFFEEQNQKSATISQDFIVSKSTGKRIQLVYPPHENYSLGGPFALINGMKGNPTKFGRDWLGFWGKDLVATIDFGKKEKVSQIAVGVLSNEGSWIYYPKEVEFWISKDGKNFKSVKKLSLEDIQKAKGILSVNFKSTEAQFVKVIAKNAGKIADGRPGAGSNAWLFVDEISVD